MFGKPCSYWCCCFDVWTRKPEHNIKNLSVWTWIQLHKCCLRSLAQLMSSMSHPTSSFCPVTRRKVLQIVSPCNSLMFAWTWNVYSACFAQILNFWWMKNENFESPIKSSNLDQVLATIRVHTNFHKEPEIWFLPRNSKV